MKLRFLIISVFFIILLSSFFAWWAIFLRKSPYSLPPKEFLIEKGEGLKEIALNLEKEGLIKNRYFFSFYAFLTDKTKKLQAGKYLISSSESIAKIAKKIALGDVVKKKITIIEGWNLRDIGWYLENKGIAQAEELFELVGFPMINYSQTTDLPKPKDFSNEFGFLKDKSQNVGLEGYLFPDTYEISSEGSVEEIIKKILANFDKKLMPELREEIIKQNKSIFEIVVMASLLEKEVRTLEEKKQVSGILWKRLRTGIPLQVDATIIYILSDNEKYPERYITGGKTTKVSRIETHIDSLYNTYKYLGLPVGPICNSGIESIKAAIYSQDSQYWYYLSTPEGETIFSRTLEEHNIAKARHLK